MIVPRECETRGLPESQLVGMELATPFFRWEGVNEFPTFTRHSRRVKHVKAGQG